MYTVTDNQGDTLACQSKYVLRRILAVQALEDVSDRTGAYQVELPESDMAVNLLNWFISEDEDFAVI